MAKVKNVLAMLIFGTVGIFVRNIPLPSSVIALARGVVGTLFLFLVVTLSGRRVSKEAVRRNLPVLIVSGVAIGINWILLFEAYRYTTVAVATLCYYLAPVFVILLSPVVLKEKLTKKKLLCVAAALTGMALISGIFKGASGGTDFRGILFGVGAGAFYACVILMNQFLRDISSFDSTILQLTAASVSLLPYVLLTEPLGTLALPLSGALFLLAVGIGHTGIGYCLYFSSLADLDGQTAAIFSYIDPVVAVLLSAFLLHERMDAWSAAGAALILGSTLASEIRIKKLKG